MTRILLPAGYSLQSCWAALPGASVRRLSLSGYFREHAGVGRRFLGPGRAGIDELAVSAGARRIAGLKGRSSAVARLADQQSAPVWQYPRAVSGNMPAHKPAASANETVIWIATARFRQGTLLFGEKKRWHIAAGPAGNENE